MFLAAPSLLSSRGRRVAPVASGGSAPAWYTSANDSEWLALTGGAADTISAVNPCPGNGCSYSIVEGQPAVVDDWCGAVASPNSLIIGAQGGHQGYAGNELYEFVFNVASPRWYRRIEPSTSVQQDVAYYSDGKPSSNHGYGHDCYIASGTNGARWFIPFMFAVYGGGNFRTARAASWPVGGAAYDAELTFPDFPGQVVFDSCTAYDPTDHAVWVVEGSGNQADWTRFKLNVATKTWTTYESSPATSGFFDGSYTTAFIDPVRRVFVACSGSTLYLIDLVNPTNQGRTYTVTGLSGGGPGWKYEPRSGKWVHWNGGKTLRIITPPTNYRTGDGSTSNPLNGSASYSVGQTITPTGGATPTAADQWGTWGRFNWIEDPGGFCVVNDTTQSMYFFKVPTGGL